MMNEIAIDYYLIGGSNPSQEYDWISSSHLWLNIANIWNHQNSFGMWIDI